MKSRIIPISGTNVLWPEFLKIISDFIGYSPVRGIDASGQELSNYAKFIVALGESHKRSSSKPLETMKDAGLLLEHLHFSFLIVGTTPMIFKIMELTKLDVVCCRSKLENMRLALVSGTLGTWKESIINCCISSQSEELRRIFNMCLEFFFTIGLRGIWANYTRVNVTDDTYLLEYNG